MLERSNHVNTYLSTVVDVSLRDRVKVIILKKTVTISHCGNPIKRPVRLILIGSMIVISLRRPSEGQNS